MRILTHTQIGSSHSNHNEDAFATAELTDRHHLIAVINGSSAGEKGYFTAALVGQLLRKIARETSLTTFATNGRPTTAALLRDCTEEILIDLADQRSRLNLADEDLRLTLTMGVVDAEAREAELVVVGSGIISCDGETVEMSQYATPDYLGDHLDPTDFERWWAGHDKRVVCQDCLDLAISSMGILTFEPFSHDPYRPVTEDEIITFLLTERNDGPVEQLFRRKMLYIEEKFGLLPTDDVTVVRVFLL